MDEDGKQTDNAVRQLRDTPVILEGVIGVATWDEATGQLCFVPDQGSAGYREAAARDGGDWERWVVEYPLRVAGKLLVLEAEE